MISGESEDSGLVRSGKLYLGGRWDKRTRRTPRVK